jgi:hypothetical protein
LNINRVSYESQQTVMFNRHYCSYLARLISVPLWFQEIKPVTIRLIFSDPGCKRSPANGKEMLAKAEEAEGPSENWDVNKWKDFATKVLNSDEPAIKNFLDELEENNAGAKAALATAISSRVSLSLIAKVAGAVVAADTEAFFGDFIICFTCNIQHESVTHKVISTG